MLDPAEARAIEDRFGVAAEQVRRDHLLSHLLAALGAELRERVILIGGTALARTHLPDGRLSEDIDLIAVGPRRAVVADVERVLAAAARRDYGPLTWHPPLSGLPDTGSASLVTDDGVAARVQLLDPAGYPPWPTEARELVRRYSDVPATSLRVPTLASFAAWKTAAWADRHPCRDLYDLWGLARAGAMTRTAADLFARLGPTGGQPAAWLFDRAPTDERWHAELAGQTRIAVGPAQALATVRTAWGRAVA